MATNDVVKVEGEVAVAVDRLVEIAAILKGLETEQKELREQVKAAHATVGADFETATGCRSVQVGATVRVGIDADRLAKELPEVFQQYAKETTIAATIRIVAPKVAKVAKGADEAVVAVAV
jgi:hypothetical protein